METAAPAPAWNRRAASDRMARRHPALVAHFNAQGRNPEREIGKLNIVSATEPEFEGRVAKLAATCALIAEPAAPSPAPSVVSDAPAPAPSVPAPPVVRTHAPPEPAERYVDAVRALLTRGTAHGEALLKAQAIDPAGHAAWVNGGCRRIDAPGVPHLNYPAFVASLMADGATYGDALMTAQAKAPKLHEAWVRAGCPAIPKTVTRTSIA